MASRQDEENLKNCEEDFTKAVDESVQMGEAGTIHEMKKTNMNVLGLCQK